MKFTLYNTNILNALSKLSDNSVDCIVTSPPYYGLRDYGKLTETIWDPKAGCVHNWQTSFCSLCGAWKGQLGLEPDYKDYLKHMLTITGELKRVLKSSGTMWWNHGDTYSGNKNGKIDKKVSEYVKKTQDALQKRIQEGISEKSRMMIPERLAIRMVDEQGWILRNTIIWEKPNHMPSSVKDRLSNGYESIFFFVKSRKYYFNLNAIRIPNITVGVTDMRPPGILRQRMYPKSSYNQSDDPHLIQFKYRKNDKASEEKRAKEYYGKQTSEALGSPRARLAREGYDAEAHFVHPLGKNPGDVWKITTKPFPFKDKDTQHFATFPPELPERCIKAGCPNEVCSECGSPKRQIDKRGEYAGFNIRVRDVAANRIKHVNRIASAKEIENYDEINYQRKSHNYVVWHGCDCGEAFQPATVLDPFAGSGTTLSVSMILRHNAIGIEINPKYITLIKKRCKIPNLLYKFDLIT